MKQHTHKPMRTQPTPRTRKQTIGIDVGDLYSHYCVLAGNQDEPVEQARLRSTRQGLRQAFGQRSRCRIALEAGGHSGWMSRELKALGQEVIVANARQLRLISHSSRKDDRTDARTLARLPQCDADSINLQRLATLPLELRSLLEPLIRQVESLTAEIRAANRGIEQIARQHYPQTQRLTQITGVGTLIALTFVLTVDDPARFARSRDVGCYLGLRPKRRSSGQRDPELRITKEGDRYLRAMLVQGAHYILGWRGPDTDLRRWGLPLAARGGKAAKRRAIVAVARKLAVLLHKLWVSGELYEPLRNARLTAAA